MNNSKIEPTPPERYYGWFFLGIIILGVIFRFWHLDANSIWSDELFSLDRSGPQISISTITSAAWSSTHPPLYIILLHLYFKVAPYTVWSGRFLSVIIGVFSIIFCYFCCRNIVSKTSALAATAILSVHNLHFFYSQELRGYSLLFFCATLAIFAMLRWQVRPTLGTAVGFGLALSLASFSHFFGLFLACSILLVCGINSLFDRKTAAFIPVCISWALSIWPIFPFLFYNTGRDTLWTGSAQFTDLAQVLTGLLGGRYAAIAVVLLFSIMLRQFWAHKTTRILMEILVVGIAVPVIFSWVKYSLFINRFYIAYLPIIILLLAFSIERLKPQIKIFVPLLLLLFMWPTWLADVNAFDRRGHGHDLRWIVQRITELGKGEAIISLNPRMLRTLFQMYSPNNIPTIVLPDEVQAGDLVWFTESHRVDGYEHILSKGSWKQIFYERKPREAVYLLEKLQESGGSND